MRLPATIRNATLLIALVPLGCSGPNAAPPIANSVTPEKMTDTPTEATMGTDHQPGSTRRSATAVPAIDAMAPAEFQTATFALG